MSNQSIVARGTMAISLVGAASLAMSAVAGANVVPGPHAAKTFSAAHTYGKQPFLSRSRRPNVGNHPPSTNIVLLGGGATLPAIAYVGSAGATGGSQPAGSTGGPSGANLVSAGSVLGYFDAHAPYPVNFAESATPGWRRTPRPAAASARASSTAATRSPIPRRPSACRRSPARTRSTDPTAPVTWRTGPDPMPRFRSPSTRR